MMDRNNDIWNWPNGKQVAIIFNVCLEAWSDGKAPGISPMGNPLPAVPGVVDTQAISWAAYGCKRGIYRLLDALDSRSVKASVAINGIIAERDPEVVKAVADRGHEIVSHSYAMDVIPTLLSEMEERENIARCTELLREASGQEIRGWLSPRGTSSPRTAQLLAEAGYLWFADVFDDDLPYSQVTDQGEILAIPFKTDVNDMPAMKYGSPAAAMIDCFEESIEAALSSGETTTIDVTAHAHIFGRPLGAVAFAKIIQAAADDPNLWIGTRGDIVKSTYSNRRSGS